MVLQFYYDTASPPCRAVLMLLKATSIPHEAIFVDLLKGEQMKPEFLKLNPFHKVPVIQEDGFVLTESVAILRYLTAAYGTAEHWYPRQDCKEQARVDEFLNWQSSNLMKHEYDLFMEKLIASQGLGPDTPKRPLNQATVDAGLGGMKTAIKHLDEYFLRDSPYIAGQEISVADLMAAVTLVQMRAFDLEECLKDNAKVAAWLERVEESLEPHFQPITDNINYLKKLFSC